VSAEELPEAHELGRRIAGALKGARAAEQACHEAATEWGRRPTPERHAALRLAEDGRADAWREVWQLVGEAP
jgi:acyl-CoA reductase-like NAD-dependent aldehyde dehydrogenase